jgi:GT2 family glycosyltransferase
MKIDIIIPNYNGSALIEKNLGEVIKNSKKYNAQIIIVDDFSKKEDFDKVERFVSDKNGVKLLRNDRNLGFSSTINRGVRESDADISVLLNTDVSPEENFLDAALADFKEDENLFGVGLMDKSIEGDKTVLRGRGLASWSRGFVVHRRGEVDRSDTFWISGGSSAVRRELFVKLGGMDELYNPFYWEDIDLSYRARKSGYNICFEEKCVVVHNHQEGAIKRHYTNSQVKKIAYRNQFIFVWKNITDIKLIISHVIWLPINIILSIARFDSAFIIALFNAILKIPAIINKRGKQKRFYKLRDAQLI